MKLFDDDKLYMANDPALRVIAPYSTMAHWRSEGRGPAYIKVGAPRRILRAGAQRVVEQAHRPAAVRRRSSGSCGIGSM